VSDQIEMPYWWQWTMIFMFYTCIDPGEV